MWKNCVKNASASFRENFQMRFKRLILLLDQTNKIKFPKGQKWTKTHFHFLRIKIDTYLSWTLLALSEQHNSMFEAIAEKRD